VNERRHPRSNPVSRPPPTITALAAHGLPRRRHRTAGKVSSGPDHHRHVTADDRGPVADVSKSGLQGYQLWSSQAERGGRPARPPASSWTCSTTASTPNQTATDYTRLISQGQGETCCSARFSSAPQRAGLGHRRPPRECCTVEPSGGAATLFTRGLHPTCSSPSPATTTSEAGPVRGLDRLAAGQPAAGHRPRT